MSVCSKLTVPSVAVLIAMVGLARAQLVSRVSVNSAGGQAFDDSSDAAISANERFVAFESWASTLVATDTNGVSDIFVHDRLTGETSRVSVDSAGTQGNLFSFYPSISGDGRYVSFTSSSEALVAGDSNGVDDIFVHDRLTAETSRVSLSSEGDECDEGNLFSQISADGRIVAFSSFATNLVSADTNRMRDVFVHDRWTGETTRVSVDSAGTQGNSSSGEASLSATGRYVAFSSYSNQLVPGDSNGVMDAFVHDRDTGETSRVSVSSSGIQANDYSGGTTISAGGRYVAFISAASNLVSGDTNRLPDVFFHDRQLGVTSRESVNSEGIQGNGSSYGPTITTDGRYVAFMSYSTNLVPGDTNGVPDVFVRDRAKGETWRVSSDSAGIEGDRGSGGPSISPFGRSVAFSSSARNLVLDDTNDYLDIFVRVLFDACAAGNVNGGAGDVTEVLFVNDSTGGSSRTVRLVTFQPLTIFMAAPPSAAGFAPFALYAWRGVPVPGGRSFSLPFEIGDTCLPTPLTGGSPAPRVVWNNTGSTLPGAATFPSSPAPSIVLQRPRAFSRPVDVFVQGIIRDRGARNGRAAVTNGVSIEVR